MYATREPGIVVNPGGPSAPGRLFEAAFRAVVRPVLRGFPINRMTLPVGAALIDGLSMLRPEPAGIDRELVEMKGFRMEIVRPAGASRALRHGAVLYFHGGGFAICGIRTHRPVAAGLARRTGLPVVNVEYRQLPGTRITESLADCLEGYRWLLRHRVDPARIVIAGDSAGGLLAFSTVLAAMQAGLPAPAGILGLSPLLDLDYAAKREYELSARDAYIPLAALTAVVRLGGEVAGVLDPKLSPVNANLTGLPPVLLIVAEQELLRFDSELMARRLTAAGVPNSLELWRGTVHDFMSIAPNLPEGRAALARASRFIRARIEETEQVRTA
ncbi:alpha/beta hydrolase [Nocardia cyriacigeorgica]|uniref:alpha/beta hydrolase n=1 Tax=Nocardia cyriacigeorgica TaxID=135487 RepID=UPI0020174061|nr:alpha/beta hydrolase [Nocardia cyriacigeorgica]